MRDNCIKVGLRTKFGFHSANKAVKSAKTVDFVLVAQPGRIERTAQPIERFIIRFQPLGAYGIDVEFSIFSHRPGTPVERLAPLDLSAFPGKSVNAVHVGRIINAGLMSWRTSSPAISFS